MKAGRLVRILEASAILLVLTLGVHVTCQSQGVIAWDHGFEVYTSADGLGSDVVRCMLITSDGTKWVGTNHGLSKFDGDTWVNYLVEPGASPPSTASGPNSAMDITVDALKRPWVAFWGGSGPRCFLGDGFDQPVFGDGLVSFATCLNWTDEGDLWVGSFGCVGRYSPTEGWQFFCDWSGSSGAYYAVNFAEGEDRVLWIGTYAAVWEVRDRGGFWDRHLRSRDRHDFRVSVLDDGRKITVANHYTAPGESTGFISTTQDGTTWTTVTADFGTYPRFGCVTPTDSGGFWIGTCGGALRYDGHQWRYIEAWYDPAEHSDKGNGYDGDITDIAVDGNGDVWFTSRGYGVGVLRGGVEARPPAHVDLVVQNDALTETVEIIVDAAFEMRLTLDFYLAVQTPDGTFLFAPEFGADHVPLFRDVSVSGRQRVADLPVLTFETQGIPSGTYRFYSAFMHAGTMDFASNIASCEWQFNR